MWVALFARHMWYEMLILVFGLSAGLDWGLHRVSRDGRSVAQQML